MKNTSLLLAVLAQLERERMVSIPQLARLLGADEQSVSEVLETLVFAYDTASIRLDLHDTYAQLVTNRPERLLRLTARETDALIDALRGVGFSADDALVEKLLATKSLLDEQHAPEPRMQVVSAEATANVTQTLAVACEDEAHHLLRIVYQGEGDTRLRPRVVEPALFFSREGKRYLLAYCHKAQAWRSFRLDRVQGAEILEERFTPRKDIPSAFEEFRQAIVKTHVRFDPNAQLPSWHGMRIVKTLDDGSRVAQIDWVGSMWLPKRIVAYMGAAVPLDPPELFEACLKYARSLA